MRRPRFKIAGLMGLVVLVAIGLVAVRSLPEWWPGPAVCLALVANALACHVKVLIGIAIGLNLVAPLLAIARKGPVRAMAAGYAIGGWTYLELSFNVPLFGPFFDKLTTKYWVVINHAHRIHEFSENLDFGRYRMAGHCVLTVAAGVFGGLLARKLTRRPVTLGRPIPITAETP